MTCVTGFQILEQCADESFAEYTSMTCKAVLGWEPVLCPAADKTLSCRKIVPFLGSCA